MFSCKPASGSIKIKAAKQSVAVTFSALSTGAQCKPKRWLFIPGALKCPRPNSKHNDNGTSMSKRA